MTLTRKLSLTCCLLLAVIGAKSFAQSPSSFDLPAQSLATALCAVASQTGTNVLFDPPLVEGRTAPALKAQLSASQAYEKLLRGTGLILRTLDEKTVMVVSLESSRGAADSGRSEQGEAPTDESKEVGKKPSQEFRVAQLDQGKASRTASVGNPVSSSQDNSNAATTGLSEIIVTAQKRSQRLQDVPVPVTAIDTNTLAELNQNRLGDYFATVPGLSLNAGDLGLQTVSIRGISTGIGTNPTVGVTIDDVPFGSSSVLGLATVLYPDIDPSSLSRIEVLRGPQGTLYGASSMGGLLKFVTADPSTNEFSGRFQLLGSSVDHGGMGYGVQGAVNLPLSDQVAIRASGFTRDDPGYVNNVMSGLHDVNEVVTSGGHLSALWHPSDALSLKLGVLFQKADAYGSGAVNTNSLLQPIIGDLLQSQLPGSGRHSTESTLYSSVLTWQLPDVRFESVSGYGINKFSDLADATGAVGFFSPSGAATSGSVLKTDRFTQEFRLASVGEQKLEWLGGAFYSHESTSDVGHYFANDSISGEATGDLLESNFPTTVSEYALFGNLTMHFTNRFDVQLGGRESHTRQTYSEVDTGPLVPDFFPPFSSPAVTPLEVSNDNAFTFLLTPRFVISNDLMAYARFASGYRLGGPNYNASLEKIPVTYAPDKTINYEIGFKGGVLDHLLTFDVSAYYIDWKNLQLFIVTPALLSYAANGGDAKSQGVELSVEVKPTRGLTIAAQATLSDAELTQNFPESAGAIGLAGDRLPFSSRFAGSLSVDEDIPLSNQIVGSLGASVQYVGTRESEFVSAFAAPGTERLRLPSYVNLNLHTGVRIKSWETTLFVNNVADRRGIAGGGISYGQTPYYAVYIQPRTAGLSITKSF